MVSLENTHVPHGDLVTKIQFSPHHHHHHDKSPQVYVFSEEEEKLSTQGLIYCFLEKIWTY